MFPAIWTSCFILGLVAQADAGPWGVVRSADGDFAFSMPVGPEVRPGEDNAKAASKGLAYSCTVDGCVYSLRRVRTPRSIEPAQVVAEVSRVKRGIVGGKARIVRETPVAVDGVIGHDFSYKIQDPQGKAAAERRTRVFLKDRFLYELTVAAPPGRPLPKDATRFLSSLTFEAVVQASRGAHGGTKDGRPEAEPSPKRETTAESRPGNHAAGGRSRILVVDGTPEQALETFLLALAAQDEAALHAVSLPDDEFDLLLKDRPPPATEEALAAMREGFKRKPFRRLTAGRRIRMPGGRTAVIKPSDVAAGRAVLLPEGAPMPARVEDVGGHWKVLPRTFILMRKAADAARGTATNRPSTPGGRPRR